MRKLILVAEDDATIRSAVTEYLGMTGWEVTEVPDGLAARTLLQQRAFDLVLSDIRMPELDGLALFNWIKQAGLGVPVILMTAHGDAADGIAALKQGVADYLSKPFDLDELNERLNRVLEAASIRTRLTVSAKLPERTPAQFRPAAGPLAAVYDLAVRVAKTDSTVLIQGESGTGKEVLARFIHEASPRREGPFVAVNAAAIPQSLIESELFGHEKGAFSGADRRRIGHFESAQHGTIFLDEIGDLPLALQATLLRVLQERYLTRLGSSQSVPLDIRILTATNRNLLAMVAEGSFRQDLYYRLQVVNLTLPPLRERPEDIVGLCAVLLPKLATRLGMHTVPDLSPRAVELLQSYSFPGNIRELENLLERALILAGTDRNLESVLYSLLDIQIPDGTRPSEGRSTGHGVLPAANPVQGTNPSNAPDADPLNHQYSESLPESYRLSDWEAWAIKRALVHCRQNRTKAAEILGIGRRTLQQKIKAYWPEEAADQS